MRNYEIMIIVNPTLDEKTLKGVIESFSKVITTNGGKVTGVNDMGQRELAYEIKNNKTGYYYVYNVEAKDDKAINEFNRLALIDSNIIRHLITKKEK